MSTENSNVSQNAESPTIERDAAVEALYDSFNVKPPASTEEIKFPELGETQLEDEEEDDDPAIDQEETLSPIEGKKLKVKFNKDEVEVDISTDEKLTDHLQRSLALDKERDRVKQSQNDLDRAAKLLGYTDHAALSAGLDALEKNQLQEQENKFERDRQKLIDDLVYNGADETAAREFIDNNPLIQEGRKALEAQQKNAAAQEENSRWKPLYEAYPDIQALAQKGDWSWFTPELAELSKRNDPLLAYEHINKATTQTQTKKQLEQKIIKQQQLGNRSNTLGNTSTETVTSTLLPAQQALAEMFGVSVQGVEKQQKLINSRR